MTMTAAMERRGSIGIKGSVWSHRMSLSSDVGKRMLLFYCFSHISGIHFITGKCERKRGEARRGEERRGEEKRGEEKRGMSWWRIHVHHNHTNAYRERNYVRL